MFLIFQLFRTQTFQFANIFVIGVSLITGILLEKVEELLFPSFSGRETESWMYEIVRNREYINKTMELQNRFVVFKFNVVLRKYFKINFIKKCLNFRNRLEIAYTLAATTLQKEFESILEGIIFKSSTTKTLTRDLM